MLIHEAVLDVIPLFETAEDLARAPAVLDAMLELEPVRRRLEASGRELEVMLGYSDSTKEVGPVSATFALYQAQETLARWARERDVRLTLFTCWPTWVDTKRVVITAVPA